MLHLKLIFVPPHTTFTLTPIHLLDDLANLMINFMGDLSEKGGGGDGCSVTLKKQLDRNSL